MGLPRDCSCAGALATCGCFLATFGGFGGAYSLGVFLVPIERELRVSRASTSGLLVLVFAMQALANGFVGLASDRLGARPIVALGGAVVAASLVGASFADSVAALYVASAFLGLGVSLSFMPGLSDVSKHFGVSVALVVAVCSSGGGVGNLALPPLLQGGIDTLGWRVCMRFSAFLGLVVAVGAALAVPPKSEAPAAPPPSLVSGAKALFMDPVFRLLFVAQGLGFAGYQAPFVHVAAYAVDAGLSADQASIALSLMGGGSIVGRLIGGLVAARSGRPTLCMCVNLALLAATQAFWVASGLSGAAGVLVWSAAYGAFSGPFVALPPSLARQYFPSSMVGSASGLLFMAGVPGYIFGIVVGALYDASGSYLAGSLIGAALQTAGAAVLLFLTARGEKSWTRNLAATAA